MSPLKIVILSNNYHPELTGPASYITTLAEYLVSCGDSVTVLTSPPHYPHWKFYPGYGQSFYKRTIENGVEVVRGPLYVPASPTALKRIAYDLSYTLSSLMKGVTLREYEVVICVSPPLTIGLTAEILGFLKRCPFILHIMDLIPDAPVALGMLKNRTIISALHRLEKHVYNSAGGIVALLSTDFSRLVIVAFGLGAPFAYLGMQSWLQDFAYHVEVGPGVFASAGAICLLVALVTTCQQALQAALTNPIDTPRQE